MSEDNIHLVWSCVVLIMVVCGVQLIISGLLFLYEEETVLGLIASFFGFFYLFAGIGLYRRKNTYRGLRGILALMAVLAVLITIIEGKIDCLIYMIITSIIAAVLLSVKGVKEFSTANAVKDET